MTERCERTLKLSLGYITEKGDYRKKNQDRILCRQKSVENHLLAVACVCDGIGSMENSEIASQMMIQGISDWFDGIVKYYPHVLDEQQVIEDLEVTLQELNELVYEYRKTGGENIGCTMSLLLLIDWRYQIFHVGDSRIYRLRDRLLRLTQDETVRKQVNGKEKTLLANYIGKKRLLSNDRGQGVVESGDVFILGTDGLYKKLTYEDVCYLWKESYTEENLKKACCKLVTLVSERGERDNISCAILKVVRREHL